MLILSNSANGLNNLKFLTRNCSYRVGCQLFQGCPRGALPETTKIRKIKQNPLPRIVVEEPLTDE